MPLAVVAEVEAVDHQLLDAAGGLATWHDWQAQCGGPKKGLPLPPPTLLVTAVAGVVTASRHRFPRAARLQPERSLRRPAGGRRSRGRRDVRTPATARANATKLGRSGRDERHLFVWVDDLHPLWTVFDSTTLADDTWDLLPQNVPNLPPEITTAWAATEKFDTVVWQVRPPEPWGEVFRGPR